MMSEEETTQTQSLKLDDAAILMVRELLQFSILTNSNVIDQFRGMRFKVNESTGSIVPTEEYIAEYNSAVETLLEQAKEKTEEAQNTLV